MAVRLTYPNLYINTRLKDSALHEQLQQADVRVVVRFTQEADICLINDSVGLAYLNEADVRLGKADHDQLLQPLQKYEQALVLVRRAKKTSDAFDKLQLRIATTYGYTMIPVNSESDAAKILSKLVGGRLRWKPQGMQKPRRPEPVDVTKMLMTIHGVGEQKAKALIAHFKTLRALANAGPEELSKVASVGPSLGKNIDDFFQDSFNSDSLP